MKVHIGFQGGTHGHFLRYILDRFSALTPHVEPTPFTADGTSHSEEFKRSEMFRSVYHPDSVVEWVRNGIHIIITVNEEDILPLQRIVYTRPGDIKLNIDTNNIIVDKKFFDKENIEKLYNVKVENTIPRFILRDYCKLGFSDIKNHGLTVCNKQLISQKIDNVYYFPVNCFWDKKLFLEQIKIVNDKFNFELSIDDEIEKLHDQFIGHLNHLKTRYRCRDIISAIKENKDIPIQDLDFVEEAYIYSWIETTHKNIFAPFTNTFFKCTQDIIDYINWYPHFYHGMNPTLPEKFG